MLWHCWSARGIWMPGCLKRRFGLIVVVEAPQVRHERSARLTFALRIGARNVCRVTHNAETDQAAF